MSVPLTIEADGHANATTPMPKPPTQVAGVEGIAPKPIVLTPESSKIDWARIIQLPPFQMFAVEICPNLAGNFDDQGLACVHAWMAQYEPDDLYKQYAEWHLAKGYWPNETPCGEII